MFNRNVVCNLKHLITAKLDIIYYFEKEIIIELIVEFDLNNIQFYDK